MTRSVCDASAYVAVQRVTRRRTRTVPVTSKDAGAVSVTGLVEGAFFPRFFWLAWCGFAKGDPDGARMAEVLRADMNVYVRLLVQSQYPDFVGRLENAAFASLEPFVGHGRHDAGGWNCFLVLMTGFLLMKWADQHATHAICTTGFSHAAQDILTHLDQLYGADCDDVTALAHGKLPLVIRRLKACGLFTWLPDYRGGDQ